MARRVFFVLIAALFLTALASATCSSPENPIEAENCLPGSGPNEWYPGASDPTIQGFATTMSVNVGQTMSFKVSTTASSYHIAIYRIGYYQGNGARLIATFTPTASLAQGQPACATDSTSRLYDCGTWRVSASWTVPSNATSGLYLAWLVRDDTGGDSYIPFVVRNDSSTSAILFQTSDESWQAYNGYGGHSLYGPSGFDLTDRAYKVSYNRPLAPIEIQTQPFYAEYPMIRWLEANSYDVSYFSSVDAAQNGSLIKDHQLYLSVGHDEYVSGPKRTSIEAARDAGVNLAFFSGNEFFWKTRWENSIDGSNTPYRTLVCYKETLNANSNPAATTMVDPLDPPTWTGTWRDPTKSPPDDGGRPENALTGQLFRVNGPGTDNTNLSIKIPAAQGKVRFWRNTAIAAQSANQTWTLPAATLGYEWDTEEDNGFRPAGLFDLSTATYALTADYLQDYGGLYGAGTAAHHMSLYRAPSGALVFGAGTVQWSWGLDNNHDGSGPTTDINMRQATINLFADMGVQPATLQSGLSPASKSTDTTPPSSTITSPTNGTSVQPGTIVNVTGTASDSGGGIVAGVEISTDSGSTWHPATGLNTWSYSWTANKAGTFSVMSRAVDDTGNLETPSAGISVGVLGIASISLNPSSLLGGASSQATVTLSVPAAAGGTSVTLSSSNTVAVGIPASITVPAGSTSATFTVKTNPVVLSTPVTISATYVTTVAATLTVNSAFPPPAGALAPDVTVSKDQPTSSATLISPAFSTLVSNELILAMISSDSSQPNMTVSSVTGAGLTWTLAVRTNTQGGTSEIWKAFASSVLTNVSVTASFSQSSPSASMTIVSFAGVDTTNNGSAAVGATASGSSARGAPTASLTTTRSGSWVVGVGNDYDNAIARTVGANQVLVHQALSPTGDTYWTQIQNSATPTSGASVTLNDTAPTTDSFNLSILEVRPPLVGTFSISGTISPIAAGAGATVALTGAATQTVTADSLGNFSFTALTSGSYTVTPSQSQYVFSPASQLVTISGANVANVNFTGSLPTPILSISSQSLSFNGIVGGSNPSNQGVNITNTGTGTLTFSAGSDSPWLTASPASGTAPQSLQIGISSTGLTSGTYTGHITVSAAGAQNSPERITVTFTLSPPTPILSVSASSLSFSGTVGGANPPNQSVSITNTGTGTLSFTASSDSAWLTASPTSGSAPQSLQIGVLNTALAAGSYTGHISVTAVGALNSPATITVTFTLSAAGSGLAIDANVSKDNTAASSSIASPSFSTTASDELLLALISTDGLKSNMSVSGISGGGLTWTLVIRTNAQGGTSEIWRAFSPSPLSNITVTASLSQSVISTMTVLTISGVDISGAGSGAIGATATANKASGAPTVSLTTTRNNSLVLGVGNDYSNAVSHTAGTGQTVIHQLLATSTGDTYWMQRQTATTQLSGTTVTINDTAPTGDSYNVSVVEVRTP